MRNSKRLVHAVFGTFFVILAAVSAGTLYLNRGLPVIRPATPAGTGSNPQLPQDHPPIDNTNRLAALEQLSRDNPQNADLRTQIGNLHYDAGRYQEAIEAYEESLRLRPRNPNVETDLATSYHYLGRHDKALEILDQVLQYEPDFQHALFNKGIVLYAGKQDNQGAIRVWERLLEAHPNLPQRTELANKIRELKSAGR